MLISRFRLPFADLNFHKIAAAGVYNLARDGLISGRISSAKVPHQALANTQFLGMGRVRRNGGGAKSGSLKRNRLVHSPFAEGVERSAAVFGSVDGSGRGNNDAIDMFRAVSGDDTFHDVA